MLQLGDKDERGYLSLDDCRNFPKQELRTIDQLWLKYSNDHFGISIQKQIYLKYQGNLDWSLDSYRKMSEEIGWRKNGSYISYSKYVFSTKAPNGHLPSLYEPVQGVSFVWGVEWDDENRLRTEYIFSSLDYSTEGV